MIYPSYFPTQSTYNPPYIPQAVNTPQQAQNASYGANTGIIWVQGEAGAKSYMVAPNNTVQLWDSEAQVIYLKSADASGMPSMKVIDYTIREQSGSGGIPVSDGVTRAEMEQIRKEIETIRQKLEAFGMEASDGKSTL